MREKNCEKFKELKDIYETVVGHDESKDGFSNREKYGDESKCEWCRYRLDLTIVIFSSPIFNFFSILSVCTWITLLT